MFTLRYTADAPLQPRPHAPTVAKFTTRTEALLHLADQDDDLLPLLEVVER